MPPLALLLLATLASCDDILFTAHLTVGRELKRKLGYVEDAILSFPELATKYGYPVERHDVVSEDGYILTVFRIPRARRSSRLGPPVLVFHGLTDSADTWIFPGPRRGLGYLVSEAGYDLWCANFRGNKYSRRHTRLNPDADVEYWKFSYDEMAKFDLPAVMDYILSQRGLKTLSYVGFSQGTTIFFAMGASRPEYYRKIDVAIALAPVAWLTNAFNPYLRRATKTLPKLEAAFNKLGLHELLANSSVYGQSMEFLCQLGKATRAVCSTILFNVAGFDEEQLTDDMVPLIAGHVPCGVSLQNLVHLGQGFHSTKFRRYDGGPAHNLEAYGSRSPPAYNLSLVSTPVALVVGANDWLSAPRDARRLRRSLPNVAEYYVVPRRRWQHTDHLWAREAPALVGNKIVKLLRQYSKRSKSAGL